jgi:cupin fold WbuC family metalloprotein
MIKKIQFLEVKKAKTKSYKIKNKNYFLNKKILGRQYNKLSNNKNISRILIHKKNKTNVHQMLIFQLKGYSARIKKHPKKTKTYVSIEGKQMIKIFSKDLKVIKSFILDKKNFICEIYKNTIHQNITLSKKSIHIETIPGPFNVKKDNIFFN